MSEAGFSVAARFPRASASFLAANAGLSVSSLTSKTTPAAPEPRRSALEDAFDGIWSVLENAPAFVSELQGIDGRRFRFDRAWIHPRTGKPLLCVELEGTTRQGGRHQRKEGFESDAEKYFLAFLEGWQVVRLTRKLITPTNLVHIRDTIRRLQAA